MTNTRQFCTQCNSYHKTNSKTRKGYYDINHKSPQCATSSDVKALPVDPAILAIFARSPTSQTSKDKQSEVHTSRRVAEQQIEIRVAYMARILGAEFKHKRR